MVQCEKTKEGLYMVEITHSQRKMLKHILKAGEKGVRWDKLEEKFKDVATPRQLYELTKTGLLRSFGETGNEWDFYKDFPNLPKADELYATCTEAAKETVKRDDALDRKDRLNLIIGIIGAITGIIGTIMGIIEAVRP